MECLYFVSLLKRWMQIQGFGEPLYEKLLTPLQDTPVFVCAVFHVYVQTRWFCMHLIWEFKLVKTRLQGQ